MFEQYTAHLREETPSLSVEGSVYPAGSVATALSNLVFLIRLLFIGVIIGGGPEMLQRFGINNTPPWLLWMFENKVETREGERERGGTRST